MFRQGDEQEAQNEPLAKAWPELLAIAHARKLPGPPPEFALWNLYAPIASGNADRPFVIGQLGQSLDGRVATASGHSRYINGPEGIRHLHRLRALADAVVVGVGTVLADDSQLTVREVEGPNPAKVVIDPNFRLPDHARMIREADGPIHAVQAQAGARPAGVEPIVVGEQDGQMPPAEIVQALAERGFRRILIEGGAQTVSAFLAAGALDRLHLSIAPLVIGAGPVGLNLPPIERMSEAMRPTATTYRLGSDIVFDCVL
jgi:diaminohydroxyphosphoribosylaminopyrimidine deaminase / 5-amino-6-(5-phosphoribosylamino)uracil reductase